MIEIKFHRGELLPMEQQIVTDGFSRHSEGISAPAFSKTKLKWLATDNNDELVGVLTADVLWDWIYIDELWVHEKCRGTGLGRNLMEHAEHYALTNQLSGLWLWTQSWQAAEFYQYLGYTDFTRFENFPKGHSRIGFRKILLPERQ